MAKMLAFTDILMPNEVLIKKGQVFECSPAQAIQFDALKSARQATQEEIAAADQAKKVADGLAFLEPELPLEAVKPASGAPGDPQGAPKGK